MKNNPITLAANLMIRILILCPRLLSDTKLFFCKCIVPSGLMEDHCILMNYPE